MFVIPDYTVIRHLRMYDGPTAAHPQVTHAHIIK